MPSTTTTSSSEIPDLAPLYPPYLSAFNAHSWPLVSTYLSPTCHGSFRGKLIKTSAEEMRPEYEKDFARCDRHEVVIRKIEQIRWPERGTGDAVKEKSDKGGKVEGEEEEKERESEEEEWKKGIEWGLRLVLYDPTMKRVSVVHYWYREEGGKWLQCWHEILDSFADEGI